MARSQFKHIVRDIAGNVIQGARCYFYETETTTPVTDAYPSKVGGIAQASFVSNNQGEVEAWLTEPRDIKVVTTDNGGTARYPSAGGGTVTPTDGVLLVDFLLACAANPDTILFGTITRDGDGAALSSTVAWPNGFVGTYTADIVSTDFPGAIDAYHITYGSPLVRTYTQPAVTRDPTTGAVTVRPALVVT